MDGRNRLQRILALILAGATILSLILMALVYLLPGL